MNIDDALAYFKTAEKQGYQVPDVQDLSTMTEEEIIELAEEFSRKGNLYANLNE